MRRVLHARSASTEMTVIRSLSLNIVSAGFARFWQAALQLLLTPVIVHLLGPVAYGLVGFYAAARALELVAARYTCSCRSRRDHLCYSLGLGADRHSVPDWRCSQCDGRPGDLGSIAGNSADGASGRIRVYAVT